MMQRQPPPSQLHLFFAAAHCHTFPTGMPESAVKSMLAFDVAKKRVMLNQHLTPATPRAAGGGAAAGAGAAGDTADDGDSPSITASELARQLNGFSTHSPPDLRAYSPCCLLLCLAPAQPDLSLVLAEKLYSVRVQLSTSSPDWMSEFLGAKGLQGMAHVLRLCLKVPSLGLKALDAVVSGLKGGIKMEESLNAIANCEELMHGLVAALTPPLPKQGTPECTDKGAPTKAWLELRDRVTRQLLRIIAVCCTVDGEEEGGSAAGDAADDGSDAPPKYVEQGGTADVYETIQDGFTMAMSSQKHQRAYHGLLSVLDGACTGL